MYNLQTSIFLPRYLTLKMLTKFDQFSFTNRIEFDKTVQEIGILGK